MKSRHHDVGQSTITVICAALGLIIASGLHSYAQSNNCDYPRTLLILDRSTSMMGQINGQTKWDIATGAIEGMLTTYGESSYFGLMIYPGPTGLGAEGVEGAVGACRRDLSDANCAPLAPLCSTGEVVVGLGPNTAPLIQAELGWPQGLRSAYTPTWQSLEKAATYRPLVEGSYDKYAILITDGWQCCGYYEQNGQGRCENVSSERGIPVEKVELLRDRGVTVFVIGFGGGVDVQTLQNMAVAAGTARAGCDQGTTDVNSPQLCYYQASDSASLNTLLTEIARQISEEVCDGSDNDCDGQTDEGLTQTCTNACGAGESICIAGDWSACNVPDPAAEVCNNVDDDCDGQVDESLSRRCESACGAGEETCSNGTWLGCTAPPVGIEECNALDDNCDGNIDEGCDCLDGERQVCGDDEGRCTQGIQICRNNQWGPCEGQITPQEEDCNGLDDDCDGRLDEVVAQDCSTACGSGSITCEGGQWTSCSAPPASEETCNGIDDDCDMVQDEGELCQGAGACVCGGCAQPCVNGECFNAGERCINDLCVTDQCPEGTYCLESLCVEGESPFDDPPMSMEPARSEELPIEEPPQGVAPDSGCNSSAISNASRVRPWGVLLFLLFIAMRTPRGRARSHR